MAGNLLEVRELRTVFHGRERTIHAVNSVSFDLREGEILGIVGESGSGKSVTMMSLLGLLPTPPAEIAGGSVEFDGRNLLTMETARLREICGREIGFVFQNPMTSLNPVLSIGYQLMEPMRHHLGLSRRAARTRAIELLELVGIPDAERRLRDHPHQFSGGMCQRVMIAMALSCNPRVLIADEPTTALDVTIQAQLLELVRDIKQRFGTAIVWISHDLGVIAEIADRVLVMYGGRIVEQAPAGELFRHPGHPYTRALLETVPAAHAAGRGRLTTIPGQAPTLVETPRQCSFAPRCAKVFARCREEAPRLFSISGGHESACFLIDPQRQVRHAV